DGLVEAQIAAYGLANGTDWEAKDEGEDRLARFPDEDDAGHAAVAGALDHRRQVDVMGDAHRTALSLRERHDGEGVPGPGEALDDDLRLFGDPAPALADQRVGEPGLRPGKRAQLPPETGDERVAGSAGQGRD